MWCDSKNWYSTVPLSLRPEDFTGNGPGPLPYLAPLSWKLSLIKRKSVSSIWVMAVTLQSQGWKSSRPGSLRLQRRESQKKHGLGSGFLLYSVGEKYSKIHVDQEVDTEWNSDREYRVSCSHNLQMSGRKFQWEVLHIMGLRTTGWNGVKLS